MRIVVEVGELGDDYIRVYRNNDLVLITSIPPKAADIVHDMLENGGKLTLIPEPPQGLQIGNNNVQL